MTAECRNSAVNFFACAEMLCQNFWHTGVPPQTNVRSVYNK